MSRVDKLVKGRTDKKEKQTTKRNKKKLARRNKIKRRNIHEEKIIFCLLQNHRTEQELSLYALEVLEEIETLLKLELGT